MNKRIDLNNYNIRTDLLCDLKISKNLKNIKIKEKIVNDITITDINLLEDNNKLNKKKGRYITISFNDITDRNNQKKIVDILIKELNKIMKYLKILPSDKCLIVGLGNIRSTPDSLGVKTLNNILVTRYLFEIDNISVNSNFRNVSVIAPGVSGNTGIDSFDIISAIIKETKPDFIIVIDSLVSSSSERLVKTIQITTTGIIPGSGINSNKKEISFDVLNIPVITLGVPTVINIIKDKYNLLVTPKDIDFLIEKLSSIISKSLNRVLHKNFDI